MFSMLLFGVFLAVGIFIVLAKLAILAIAIPLKLAGMIGGLVVAIIAVVFVLTVGVVLLPLVLLFAVPLALLAGLVWLLMP
ncbi:MAG TPA: hypothetical protein VGK99_00115 [Acidobacteriota bacterium]|jgi:hypothetical protein